MALEDRIKRIARDENIDLQKLRRQVAYERFFARLFQLGHPDWVLKGGYAMEFRFQNARTTKGRDFTVRNRPADEDDSVLTLFHEVGAAEIGGCSAFA